MEFRVLGQLQVLVDGQEIAIPANKQRVLLATLLLRANQVVSGEELNRRIWDQAFPDDARAAVQTYMRRLRRLVGRDVILTRPHGYVIEVTADQLDLTRFEDLLARARQASDPGLEAGLLAEALALWRGSALADVISEVLHREDVPALTERRLRALERRVELDLEAGQHADLVAELRTLTVECPLRERFWAQLMRALAGIGRQGEALQAYEDLRTQLSEELGIDPSGQLQNLHRALLRGELPQVAESERRSTSLRQQLPPAQLPPDVAAFSGRARDLRHLDAMLDDRDGDAPAAVVISVIEGTAGVGKTALAVHWAHRIRPRFPDGQLYANLRGYASGPPLLPVEVLASFLRALGVPAERVPADVDQASAMYRSLLADRRVLVVLDNAAGPDQIRPLLPGGAGCLVLVTSRDRLSGLVAHEGAYRLTLDVLSPDEAQFLLTRILGVDRVGAEQQATEELAGLCGHLPLALRIAAANLADHPLHPIAAYVAEQTDCRRLGGLQADGENEGAVRAAFGLSYARLPESAQRTFRLLGLIGGPDITPAAVAALADCPMDEAKHSLDRLAGAHLVEQHQPGRYSFHDLLRIYAQERSIAGDSEPERAVATARLFAWYLHTAHAAGDVLYPQILRLPLPEPDLPSAPPSFEGADQASSWLDGELANLTAAIRQAAAQGRRSTAWLMADSLRGYLWLRRHTATWPAVAGEALAAAEADGDLWAMAATRLSLGDLDLVVGRYSEAIEHYTAALASTGQAGWSDGHAAVLGNLGIAYRSLGKPRKAAEHHAEALVYYRRAGRQGGEAVTLGNLGVVCEELGQLRLAAQHTTKALTLFRQLGSRPAEANALGNLGRLERKLGRWGPAADRLNTALTLHREVGQRSGEATALDDLAALQDEAGNHVRALELAQAAATLAQEIDDRFYHAAILNTLGGIHLHLGRTEQAIEDHQQAVSLARQTDDRVHEASALLGLAAAQRHIGQLAAALANADSSLTIASHTGHLEWEGHAHTALSQLHLDRMEHTQASVHAREALTIHRQTGHRLGEARTLGLLGQILLATDGREAAMPQQRAALHAFAEIGAPVPDDLSAAVQSRDPE